MGQLVWHQQDIENILRGAEVSAMQTARAIACDDECVQQYLLGYKAALSAVASSFGIPVRQLTGSILPDPTPKGVRYIG
ncbi:MAG: hypothetical protein IPN27_11780 [Cellvibrionales bacterium]|nr:hypothetical protein [Cellvibrionales bacterium]HQN47478.1 hypothetical protein [Rugosibacter sp.]